jgi:hypothetical protein
VKQLEKPDVISVDIAAERSRLQSKRDLNASNQLARKRMSDGCAVISTRSTWRKRDCLV